MSEQAAVTYTVDTNAAGATTVLIRSDGDEEKEFGKEPVEMTCPTCDTDIVTDVKINSNKLACCLCVFMFFIAFWICCFIPCCMDRFKEATHSCPNCGHIIAERVKLGKKGKKESVQEV